MRGENENQQQKLVTLDSSGGSLWKSWDDYATMSHNEAFVHTNADNLQNQHFDRFLHVANVQESVIYTQTGFFWHYTELFWNWTPILSLTRLLSLWTSIDAEVSAPGCYMSRSISFTCPGGCARTHILLSMKARGVSHVSCQLDGLELITRNVQPWAVLLLQFNQENNIYWSLYNIGVQRGSKLSRHAAQAEQAAGIQFPTK